MVEGGQIYSDIVLSLESKKEEKEKVLNKNIVEFVGEEIEEMKYVDVTLLMGLADQLIKHAPTLRLTFE